ncbi:hypothetical protein AK812_SmicGene7580 [Symbiodinium microadriaticum]|uniref:Uncharacterized protein n=1 Tax=Symbiodinium microadriaticum TaxID=2951 RepID=A0A1Q9END8_SYMMI|nr:hypothetical protein AK812_SmicGene7580 [Symbiodinium microadriaticum]
METDSSYNYSFKDFKVFVSIYRMPTQSGITIVLMELLRCYVIVVILSHILIATRVSGSTRLVLEVVIHIIIVAIITIIIIIIVIAVIFTNIVMIIVVISSVEMEDCAGGHTAHKVRLEGLNFELLSTALLAAELETLLASDPKQLFGKSLKMHSKP